jgi:hypothetical protein
VHARAGKPRPGLDSGGAVAGDGHNAALGHQAWPHHGRPNRGARARTGGGRASALGGGAGHASLEQARPRAGNASRSWKGARQGGWSRGSGHERGLGRARRSLWAR